MLFKFRHHLCKGSGNHKAINPICHSRYINILTWLHGSQDKLLYWLLFSICIQVSCKLRALKIYYFDPKALEPCQKYWYMERGLFGSSSQSEYSSTTVHQVLCWYNWTLKVFRYLVSHITRVSYMVCSETITSLFVWLLCLYCVQLFLQHAPSRDEKTFLLKWNCDSPNEGSSTSLWLFFLKVLTQPLLFLLCFVSSKNQEMF